MNDNVLHSYYYILYQKTQRSFLKFPELKSSASNFINNMEDKELAYFSEQGIIYKALIGKGSFGNIYMVYSTHYHQSL